MRLKGETTVVIDADDLLAMITETLCSYGALGCLQATEATMDERGDLTVTLNPKPEEE